jgi:hypothetical protein
MSVYTTSDSHIATSPNIAQEKSIGELFADLTRDSTQLIRQEVILAKTEITQKVTSAGKDAAMIAAGGFIAYVGVLTLVVAVVCGLVALGLSVGIASLIVGVVFCIAGGVIIMQGIAALKHIDPVPHQTIQTLKEDQKWAKEQR